MTAKTAVFLVVAAILNVAAQTLNKTGLNGLRSEISYSPRGIVTLLLNPYILSGIFVQIVAMFVWFYALKSSRMVVALPILYGLIFLFIVPASLVVLHERMSACHAAGMVLILAGISLIAHRL